jgi:two-component system cell cycle sensor histidine kinase/response regulator CckA
MNRAQKLESLGILASGIAHDFNFLLSSIMENIHVAVINVNRRDVMRGALQKAQKASGRAKDLTRQLLDFSRGGFPVKRVTALGGIIREYADLAIRDSNVGCAYNIATDLYPVEADEEQIGRVINTIVLNSIEAMPGWGMIMITAENIEVSAGDLPQLPQGRYVKVSIADRGTGIPHELLQKIFDPYFTTKQSGRGLGLTITYAIIRNHDGHIRVESEPDKGTVLHIYLPARR